MNIYHLERTDEWGYDDYDSCVVIAPNADIAKTMHPGGEGTLTHYEDGRERGQWGGWVDSPDKVEVTHIGTVVEGQSVSRVVCASYNAG